MSNKCKNVLWAATIAIWCAGCDQPTASPVSSTSLPPPLRAQTVLPGDLPHVPAVEPPMPAAQFPAANAVAAPPPGQAPAAVTPATPTATAPRIRLSTGIALAQTLPDGTNVLCSIDYQWVSGGAQQGAEYVWVIELGNGHRMSGPANVAKARGTIEPILRGVKPDQGPFRAAVYMKRTSSGSAPEPVSDFINLTN